jgi:hypothetical protein
MPLKNKPMQQIRNARQLRRAIANGQYEFRLCLRGGLYSSKTITVSRDGRFHVVNHIDDSTVKLSGRQLYTESNIGEGMKRRCFIAPPHPHAECEK